MGQLPPVYVGCRTISGLLIVFITDSYKRYVVLEYIRSRSSLVVDTTVFFAPQSTLLFSKNTLIVIWFSLLISVSSYVSAVVPFYWAALNGKHFFLF